MNNTETHEWEGKTYTVRQLAKKLGVREATLRSRIRRRNTLEEAIHFVPEKRNGTEPKKYELYGRMVTIKEAAVITGVSQVCLRNRVSKGLTLEAAVEYVPGDASNGGHGNEEYEMLCAGKSLSTYRKPGDRPQYLEDMRDRARRALQENRI